MIKQYYELTKPGIIKGNLLTATGGFLLASKGSVDFGLLIATLTGISLVIASACVFNNYIDRGIDKKMARTKKRAIVSGAISGQNAILYAIVLGSLGFLVLAKFTNLLTLYLGLFAIFSYVVLYGISKRRSVYGTIVGTVPGAMPPVAGYTAVTNNFDGGAIILFLILVFWQLAHFYSIAIYRFNDYKSAGIPALPVVKGVKAAKIHIMINAAAFVFAASALTIFGYTGYSYLLVMAALGLVWLGRGLGGYKATDSKLWARKMFLFSLIVITGFSIMLSLDSMLP